MKKNTNTYTFLLLSILIGFFSCNNKDTKPKPQTQETILDLRPFRSEWDLDQWKKFRMLCDYKNIEKKKIKKNQIQLNGYCDCVASLMIDEGYQPEDFNREMIELKTQISDCLIRNIKRQ